MTTIDEPVSSVAQTTARGVRLAGIGYVGSQALTFGAYLVLVRLIGPRGFGLYAAGTLVTGVGGLFAESGMLAAIIKRRDRVDEAASTAFVALVITGSLLTLASVAVAPLVGLALNRQGVTAVTAAMSGWLLLRALTVVPDALLQKRMSFARRVVVDPIGAVVFAVVAIALAATGAGVWALVGGTYASMAVQAAAAWTFAGFRPRLSQASFSLWRELASFARSIILAETLRRLAQQVDALALGRFSGAAVLGQYRNGLRLAQQPAGAFVSVMAYVLLPAFASIGHLPERIAQAARDAYWSAMTVVIPVSFAALPLGVPLAVIFLGARWRPAGHAVAGLCGLVLGVAIISIASELLKAVGRPDVLVRVQMIGLAVTVVAVGGCATVWGLLGAAIAMSASSCLTAVYALARLSNVLLLPAGALMRPFTGPLVSAAVMIPAMLLFASLAHPLQHTELVRLLLFLAEVAVGAGVYGIILSAIDSSRRRAAVALLRRRLSR